MLLVALMAPATGAAARHAAVARHGAVKYKRYCNDKYHYCLDYPSFLSSPGEPDAHDGQTFESRSKPLRMSVWGNYSNWMNGDEMRLSEQRDWTLQHLATTDLPNPKVHYKAFTKNWFVITGRSGANIFYERTIRSKDTFVTVLLIYPAAQRAEFDRMVYHVAASLKG